MSSDETQTAEQTMPCPSCGKAIKFRLEHAGQNVMCPHCQTIFQLSEPVEVADVEVPPLSESRSYETRILIELENLTTAMQHLDRQSCPSCDRTMRLPQTWSREAIRCK